MQIVHCSPSASSVTSGGPSTVLWMSGSHQERICKLGSEREDRLGGPEEKQRTKALGRQRAF